MISIRYHVFSLIAVFLALAIGLAAGSTVVKESIVDNLRDNQDRLESELDDLQSANDELELRVGRLEETDRRLRSEGPTALLDSRLLGLPVVLVNGEGLDGDVRDAIITALRDAGADLAGEIEIRRDMVREERQGELAELVGAGPDEDPVALAARSLAAALVAVDAPEGTSATEQGGDAVEGADRSGDDAAADGVTSPFDPTDPGDEPASTDAPTTEPTPSEETEPSAERVALDDLLATWEDAGFLSADGPVADAEAPIARAPIFVVVGGRPDSDDVNVTSFLVDVVTDTVQLDDERSRSVVGDAALTDPSAPRSPLLDAVRERGDVWDRVTSVDDLEAFAGLAALTLGIDDLRIGRIGHYGVGEAADSLLPVEE